MSLRSALGRMTAVNQFIVWRLDWNPAENKFKKTPINVQNPSFPASNADPQNWLTFDLCEQWTAYLNSTSTSPELRYAMGFYFTRESGYWFLDVDKCITKDGTLTPVAQWLYSALPGCAFEWSSSQTGFHIFGRGNLPDDWQTKPLGAGLELYVQDRGVAFGLTGEASGCADTDVGNFLVDVVCPAYFPPHVNTPVGVMLGGDFEQPRSDWRGSKDDDVLLVRMLKSSSTAALFNSNKATFADFYNGNYEVLRVAYVDAAGVFDESACDMAFAALLAFWTGCHAPRIEKFMRESKLYRPKWDEHKTYLRELTITKVCQIQANVLQDKEADLGRIEYAEELKVSPAVAIDYTSKAFMDIDDQRALFKGCVYSVEDGKIFAPLGDGSLRMLSPEQFNNLYSNYTFNIDKANGQGSTTKKAFEAFMTSKDLKHPKVDKCTFEPKVKPGAVFTREGVSYLNTYMPVPVKRIKGDATPYLDLVRRMYPDGDDATIFLSYAAACVQYVGEKFTWCCVLQGTQGGGKTTLVDCVAKAVGMQYVFTPKAAELTSKFNGWLENRLLIVVNEMNTGRNHAETEGTLKQLITDETIALERKGRDQITIQNYANFFMTMNDKRGLKKMEGDRRYCMLYAKQQTVADLQQAGLTKQYFKDFNHWLKKENGYAIIAEYLSSCPIDTRFDPAGDCNRAPDSSSEAEVYIASRSSYEVELREAVEEGHKGFRGGFICWQRAIKLFDGKISRLNLEQCLKNMGYFPHPDLGEKGLTHRRVISEGDLQVRLYVNSTIQTGIDRNDVIGLYENMQF